MLLCFGEQPLASAQGGKAHAISGFSQKIAVSHGVEIRFVILDEVEPFLEVRRLGHGKRGPEIRCDNHVARQLADIIREEADVHPVTQLTIMAIYCSLCRERIGMIAGALNPDRLVMAEFF